MFAFSLHRGRLNMRIPEMKIPGWFEKVDSMPDDPPYSGAYCFGSSGAGCFALVYPIPADQAMPYENPLAVIDGIHRALGDDQGLIEVERGVTPAGRRYLYSIVKTLRKPGSVQYCLRVNIEYPECAMQVMGFFEEMGTTGVRDSMVYILLSRHGVVKTTEEGLEGWGADPYDPFYTHGVLMNCAEKKEYDAQFPQHPLSELRRFAVKLVELN